MPKLEVFFDTFFERIERQSPTTLVLAWKSAILPKVEWPEVFQGPENQRLRQFLFMVMGNRVMFPMGIIFPLSTSEPASFEFLRRFSIEAPFEMKAKYFQVGVIGHSGRFAWRKPDPDRLARLKEFVG